ncbi:MAG: hypothetical protein SOV36_01560 [Anaerostipes faecalis]|nr:hypothetical protein [Anaerostipes faecalis]
MVLSDIVEEYESVKDIVDEMGVFSELARNILSLHYDNFKSATSTYYQNAGQSSVLSNFGNAISNDLSSINDAILRLNSQTRVLYKCIGLLEKLPISNIVLAQECSELIASANNAVDKMFQIIESKLEFSKKQGYYIDFLDLLSVFTKHYSHISLLYQHFVFIEQSLYEPLPSGVSSDEITMLEIRSEKKCTKFDVYTQDIQYLSRFLGQFELIKCPGSSQSIFTRRIENGSLKIVWGSKEIDLSCLGDIINTIVSAIKSLAYLPSEIKYRNLENEAKEIENENARLELSAKKLNIINSQINTIADKLGLDSNNPSDKERIQLLCVPLIDYLENNPVGSVNCVKYNLLQELKLLDDKSCYDNPD